MSVTITHSVYLSSDSETDALGQLLAKHIGVGDTLLLSGPIGAGKSHLSRAIIRSRLGRMEDVPSPTYTLVQTYEDPEGDIWHADLYRMSQPDDVVELGLEEAFDTAICLIEWPDRLGPLSPVNAIEISLAPEHDGRRAVLRFSGRESLNRALANV